MKRIYTVAAVAAPVVALGLAAAVAVPSLAVASSSDSGSTTASTTTPNGSLTLVLTSPRAIDRTRSAAVSCTTAAGSYHASAKAVIRSIPVRVTVSVPSYDGPGTYSPSNVTLTAPGLTISKTPRASVVLSSTGGSYTFHRTGAWGRTIAGTASWTCSS
jgi:hypothetical protein